MPKTKNPSGLTNKQQIFVAAYLETLNASAALRATGYKGRSADSDAQKMLKHPAVKSSIETELSLALEAKRAGLKAKVIRLWETIQDDGNEATRDRLKASELAAKYLGILTEKVEVTGKDGAPIVYQALPETAKE